MSDGQIDIAVNADFSSLTGGITQAKSGIAELSEAFKGFGEIATVAIEVFDKAADWSKQFSEAAERVELLSQRLGISSRDAQELGAVATVTHTKVENIAAAMAHLDAAVAAAKGGNKDMIAALAQIGINAQSSYTQMDLLHAATAKFGEMANGPAKVNLAVQLFNQQALELASTLSMSKEKQKEFNDHLREFSVINEDAVAKGSELADAWDTNSLAMSGLQNVMMQAFAPAMTVVVSGINDFIGKAIASYKNGGLVAQVFQIIGFAAKSLVSIFVALAAGVDFVFRTISGAAYGAAGIVLSAFDGMKLGVEGFAIAMQTMNKIVEDALHFRWQAVESDFSSGLNDLIRVSKAAGISIENNLRQGFAMGAAEWKAADKDWTQADAFIKRLWSEPGKKTPPAPRPSGSTDAIVGTGSQKGRDNDTVQKLEQLLAAKKASWNEEQAAHGTAIAFGLEQERDYWAKALNMAGLSAKDKSDIQVKWSEAQLSLNKQAISERIEDYKRDLEAAKNNTAEKLDIARQEAAYIKTTLGAQSPEFKAANEQIKTIIREGADQKRTIADELAEHQQKLTLQGIDSQEEAAKFRVQMGLETEQQLLADERDFENQRYTIQLNALEKKKQAIDPDRDPQGYQKISRQIEELERAHQSNLTKNAQQAALQRTAIERQGITSVSQTWSQAISKMLTLQQGFGATLKQLYQGVQQALGNALASIIQKWLEQHLAALILGGAASKANAAGQIASQAAVAGASGVASMAAAPWPIDMTAPAFGASMAAAAGAFAGGLAIPSAAGGWDVPAAAGAGIDGRGGRLSIVHPHEMVLPATLANPMRDMFGSRAANGDAPIAANDGATSDFHYHDHTGTANPRQIFANRQALAQALVKAHEEGAFRGTRLSFSR